MIICYDNAVDALNFSRYIIVCTLDEFTDLMDYRLISRTTVTSNIVFKTCMVNDPISLIVVNSRT